MTQEVFTASGTFTPPAGITSVDVLLVGGGGAGGSSSAYAGGAGGGGGCRWLTAQAVTPGADVTVTVGAGGVATGLGADNTVGGSGGDSSFGALTALGGGGGGGGAVGAKNGVGGGCGGGGGGVSSGGGGTGGLGTAGQGLDGAAGSSTSTCASRQGAGGGGASASAAAGVGGAGSDQSANVGTGVGVAGFFAGGGGGGRCSGGVVGNRAGGSGGGGSGALSTSTQAVAGATNTGGGGGGAGSGAGPKNGGSGIVVVQWVMAAPGVPTSVVGTTPTGTTADLSWAAPATGGVVASYDVRIDGGTAVAGTSPHTFTGLTPLTGYSLEVRAVGSGGSSAWVAVSITTPSTAPAPAPTAPPKPRVPIVRAGPMAVRVGGQWLRSIGGHADLAFSHVWPHGCETAGWSMRPGTTHPLLRGGVLVEVFDGGERIWRGNLQEPGADGGFSAAGSWGQAQGVLALDGSGNATNVPDTAIDAAISRGALDWTRPAELSAASWGTADAPLDLLALLDGAMEGFGYRWWVDPDGACRSALDPTTPSYTVPHAAVGRGLTLAGDNYVSHLVGTYLSGAGTYAAVTVGSAAAATRWGRKETPVDLTPMGIISGATATAQVTAKFGLIGARMGYADALNVGRGEITNPGGTPVSLTMPRAGQMVRLMGVTDQTWPTADRAVTDIVIGRSSYKEGDPTVQLAPIGKATRNLAELLKVVA